MAIRPLYALLLVLGVWTLPTTALCQIRLQVTGEQRCWHKITLSVPGPEVGEADESPHPFLDVRLRVLFEHLESGDTLLVPGYFAADGEAGESGAERGCIWRAHLAPHRTGAWRARLDFVAGEQVAIRADSLGEPIAPHHGAEVEFEIQPTDKSGRDFRAKGRLEYVGERYLRFAQSGDWFLKAGPDSPETLLAYGDFDGTTTRKAPLKTWEPHARDWRSGDPTWRDGKGKGLIGAINYLASRGMNSISFLPYNAGGDGDNVWPMVAPERKLHYDCSKLDQWQVVFDHAQQQGIFLHFKLQETENDDERGKSAVGRAASLDGGDLGVQRKLYLRELVARFSHGLALNWNLGEENTQSIEQQQAMARYLRALDPYGHPIVLHTYPGEQERRYAPHLGDSTTLDGVSLQNAWSDAHRRVSQWVRASGESGHPWVCCNDEQNPAQFGVPTDPAFREHPLRKAKGQSAYTPADIRKQTLWGTLMAGGAGVEYYFGYKHAENDLTCEDFRSREALWDDCRVALQFFGGLGLPLPELQLADQRIQVVHEGVDPSSREDLAFFDPTRAYCLAVPGELCLVYLLHGDAVLVDVQDLPKRTLTWFDPRTGNEQSGVVLPSANTLRLQPPTREDWLAVLRRTSE